MRALTAAAIATVLTVAPASGATIDPTAPGPYAVGSTRRIITKLSETTPQPRAPDTWLRYPATPAGAHTDVAPGRWPLLIFSHGSCGVPFQSEFLMRALASWGMVVAAPPHPGNTTPDGAASCADLEDSFQNRVADVRFVV